MCDSFEAGDQLYSIHFLVNYLLVLLVVLQLHFLQQVCVLFY
jgi:hypothetical protein